MTSRRFESISGILSRPSAPTSNELPSVTRIIGSTADVGTAEAPVTSNGTQVTQLRPTNESELGRTVTNPPTRASEIADGGVRRIAFRLDPSLHSVLSARAAATKSSHGQIVLDSIEAAHRDGLLVQLVRAETPQPKTDGLFPQLNRRAAAQPAVPVEIRLPARAAATLDQLVEQTAADSRTKLITAALRHHLT